MEGGTSIVNYYHALGSLVGAIEDLSTALSDCNLGNNFVEDTEKAAAAIALAWFGLEEAKLVVDFIWDWHDITSDL